MAITIATLIAAGLKPTQARTFAGPLAAACEHFVLRRPPHWAALVGQCRVESENFTDLEEDLYYRDPKRVADIFTSRVRSAADAVPLLKNPRALANRVYAKRIGNGDEASGDGWRYRGRGLIQLTGRENYAAFELSTGLDVIANPDQLAEPVGACMSAAWFLLRALPAMDACNWDAVTKAVNPRMLESARRRQYSQQALEAFR